MRSVVRSVVAVAVVVASLLAVTAATGAATAAFTPNTGLVGGQTVRVDAPPNSILCEQGGTAGPSICEGGVQVGGTVPFVVHRFVDAVDCADPTEVCSITATVPGEAFFSLGRIQFAPTPPLVIPGTASVHEGNSGTVALHLPVTLSYPSTQTVTVQWATLFVPGAPDFQADPATDYTPASGTVTFTPGQTVQSVTISVHGDTLVEPNEYFAVQFRNPTNAAIGGYYGLGGGGILNDD
jgi:hypothetical protein